MIRLIAFFVLAAFVVIPCAHANEAVSEEVAAKIALEKEPGEITKTVITKTKTELVYDFTIKSLGRGMVEVEIDGHNGAITGHKVLKIDAYKDLPDPLVLEGDAKAIAIKHVQENAPGRRKPVVTRTEYSVFNATPAYKVELKSGFDTVIVYVNAQTGQVTLPVENLPQERGR